MPFNSSWDSISGAQEDVKCKAEESNPAHLMRIAIAASTKDAQHDVQLKGHGLVR